MKRKTVAGWAALLAALLLFVMIGFPTMMVKKQPVRDENGGTAHGGELPADKKLARDSAFVVPVYLTKERRVADIPLELYVRGVLAAEMPIDFAPEALKAQAIAARTYIVRRAMDHDTSNVPVAGALVTDLATHQAYMTVDEMRTKWGDAAFAANLEKLNQAVQDTEGTILTFAQKPIVAAYFSTSNGFTENSEEYWSTYIPYLRSVASPWDPLISPKYKATVTMPLTEFLSKLGLPNNPDKQTPPEMEILQKTTGQRIKTMRIAGNLFTGREVREKLALNSAQFAWSFAGGNILLTTYGYGHGVGLSQWGADALAQQGKSAKDILLYYYRGVKLEQIYAAIGKRRNV
ncbi:MAG TPA: stage II sporulation protein D [Bacilli bacterium]